MKHIKMEGNRLYCERCGGDFGLFFPIELGRVGEKIDAFMALHKDCRELVYEFKDDKVIKDFKERK